MTDEYVEKDGKWYDADGKQVWRAGTLVYDKKGLFRLFFWLYVGQFTFWMEHVAIPALFPLLMAKKGFSGLQIASLWSIFPLGALIVFPILGTLSDRTRTRWGRRRPFDMFTTPIWFLGLVMLPFVTEYWHALICMMLIGFAGAGSNVLTAFYNDVVPPELMGRFVAGMRFIGNGVGVLIFQLVGMRLFDYAPALVFLSLASIGFIGEMLMLFMVKEGEYPPPPPKVSILKNVIGFIKEGFANWYIICLWLTMGVTALGGPVMGTFFNLFFTDANAGLGLTAGRLGEILSIGTLIGLFLIMPAGWVVDKFGPKKLWGICGFLVGVIILMMYFLANSLLSVSLLYIGYAVVNVLLTATLLPIMYCFMPKDKFGQLNGSNQIVTRLLQIFGSLAVGSVIAIGSATYMAEDNNLNTFNEQSRGWTSIEFFQEEAAATESQGAVMKWISQLAKRSSSLGQAEFFELSEGTLSLKEGVAADHFNMPGGEGNLVLRVSALDANQEPITRDITVRLIDEGGMAMISSVRFVRQGYRNTFIFGGIAYILTPLFLWLMLRQPYPYGDMGTSMDPDGKVGRKARERQAG